MMKMTLISALILMACSQAFATDFCTDQRDAKLVDICEVVWRNTIANRTVFLGSHKENRKATFMMQNCGGFGSIYEGGRGTTISTLNAIEADLTAMGYQINEAEFARLQHLLLENRRTENTKKLNAEFGYLFNFKGCASGARLIRALDMKVVL